MPTPPPDEALTDAVRSHDQERAIDALLAGADPNLRVNGKPLIVGASVLGQEKLVATLLSMGANIDSVDNDGMTAVMYLASLGFTKSHQRILESLLSKGADVNAENRSGNRPLDLVATTMNGWMAKRLLEAGATGRHLSMATAKRLASDLQRGHQ